ncbi:MAG: cupin domain-containing protein [Melioribacteraceae bacterium]|nr:cupin domain-containing protein [Melioribacteraceae bacterium]
MESKKYLINEEIPWENIMKGIMRKMLGFNKDLMMVKIFFAKGAVGAKHSHHHSQTSYIEKGKFEVNIGDETKILNEGDGFYVPPNIEHGVKSLTPGIIIDVFNPCREDFLR